MDEFDAIPVGFEVQILNNKSSNGYLKGNIHSFNNKTNTYEVRAAADGTIHPLKRDQIFSVLQDTKHILQEILDLGARLPGLRNESHTDIHYFIEHYSEKFRAHYKKVCSKFKEDLVSLMRDMVHDMFSVIKPPEVALIALKKFKENMLEGLCHQSEVADSIIESLVRYNSAPLCFTPNEDSLNSIFASIISKMNASSFASDAGGALTILCHESLHQGFEKRNYCLCYISIT